MRFNRLVGAILIGGILSSPVRAADPNRFFDHPQRNTAGAYFGTSLSLTRGPAREFAPAFRFGVGLRNAQQGGASVEPQRNSLIEFQPGSRGSSAFYIGGRRLTAAEDGRGADTTTILLAVAAAAAAALVISQVADNNDDDDEEVCMIEPDLCN